MRTYRGVLKGVVGAILLSGVLAATCAASASASAYSTLVLSDGPVGYWRFGGPPASTTMTDSSGTGNTGTYLNGVTLGVPGALTNDTDTAASFDGVNDIGRVPDANSLDVGSTFTLEGWIKRSSTAKSQELFNKGGNGFEMLVMGAANGNQVWLRKANVTTVARSAGGVPADGKYHHVVAQMNGTTPKIYIDGQPDTVVVTGVQTIQNTTFPIDVGTTASAQANYDEFALYPRVLSAAEVLEHYQTGTDIPPTAVPDAKTVTEDAAATAIDVLANDTDPDGGPKSIASVTQPANGTVVITGGGTGLTYAPNANYCNSPPGTTPDTFTYTLTPGGSTTTVSVTVTCVDDPPVAVNDSATVSEDSGAAAVTVLANDTDVDGGPKSIASVTQPANGAVVITGGGTGLTYAPNANYCNSPPGTTPDTFTYTLTPGGSSATVSMTVTCVPDAPIVNTDAGALFFEGDPPVAIAPATTVTDADVGGTITGATVQITAGYAGAQDVLVLANAITHAPIVALQVGDTLTLTGTASPAAYQSALRDVTYEDTSQAPSTANRTVTFTVTDNAALTGSDTTIIVVVGQDDPPVAVNDSATVAEDSGASAVPVLANDTDVDGGAKSIASVTQPANGSVVITGGGTGLTYAPNANYCNSPPGTTPDTFTYTLSPGGSSATVSMTVTCVDDPPVAVNDAKTVIQDSGVNAVNVLANDTDVDGGPKSVASVTQPAHGAVAITGGGTGVSYTPTAGYCNSGGPPAPDTFTYTLNGGSTATVSVTVTCLDIAPTAVNDSALVGEDSGATAIAVLTNDTDPDGGPKSIASVTQPAHGTVVITGGGTGLTYAPNANYCNSPVGTDDTFTYTLTPGGSTATVFVTVTCVDDPPVAVNDSATVLEDAAATAVPVLTNDTDVDGGPKSISSVTQPANGTVVITGGGTGLTYAPSANYCNNPPGTTPDTFTYTLNGGSSATVSMTVTCVNDAPTAVADSFDVIGNTGLFVGTTRPANQAGKEITGSLLDNDTDPDTPHASLVAEPVTNAPTTQGGTITIEADGNFTYQPDDADTGITDTFTYRVCDATPCNSGTDANATGTLSLPIAGQVWYVRNSEPAGGDGTSDTPFDTLAEAEAASGTGDTTFIFDGTNTTTNLDTGYAMNSGERLIGESRPLSVDPDGGGPLPTSSLFPGTSGAQPTLTASNEDVVVLASNVLVDGIDVDPSGTGGGISGGAGTDTVTVQNVNVTDTGTLGTQPGIEMDGTTGVNRFTGVTVTNGGSSTAIGVRINNADRVLFSNTATNTIATTGAKALDVASTDLLTSRWNDITVTGSGTGAIRLNATTGQPVLGDGAGTDLSLQTTSGATAAVDIASSNTVTVDSAGTDTVSATGGPALDIRNSNGSSFMFDSASSTNSAGDGINLDTNLSTPVVINAGAIAGAAGIAFDVNGGGVGGGGVVYAGAINDGPGQSVEVTGRDGGGVTFSGNIADSADAGGGIVVSANSAGSTTFSGASKVLNTGAGNAVALSANGNPANGHLVSFTNGGLDIDTTSGTGLSASNGTLTVGGTGNSITTGSGTALNVNTAGITASNLNFDSISSNGAPNGIVLSSTGSNGSLVVAGTGGTCTNADTSGCTGGQIRNTTGADNSTATPTGTGIVLNNTLSPSLTRMWLHDNSNYAIRGTSVSGFTMANSVINGSNGNNGTTPFDDSSVWFDNLTASVSVPASVTNSYISGGFEDNFRVVNTSGSLNRLMMTSDTIGDNSAAGGNDGVSLESATTAGQLQATVQSSAFTGAGGDLLQYDHNGSGTGDLVLTGNGFSNNHPGIATGGGGLTLTNGGTSGATTMSITGANTFRDAVGNALTIAKSTGTSTQSGTFSGNTIGVNAVANSGSAEGDGLKLQTLGQGTDTWTVSNNTIRGYNNFGVEVEAGGSATLQGGAVNATITGNTIDQPGNTVGTLTLPKNGVHLNIGTVPGDTYTACAVIGGPGALANSLASAGADAVPPVGGGQDVRLRQRQSTTIRLPGYAGSPTDTAAVQAFVAANNPSGGPSVIASVNSPPGGGFTGTGSTCP